ncbi:MAG TPA: PKD domain-containing protein, partial [Crocinitomicaceae bacterium]|nr:PKD domain-containing protein [Crocinitomicaceae bacterium]
MKKIVLGIFIGLPGLFFAQKADNNSVSNMQKLEWGTESHVIPCSNFSISQPLIDLSVDESELRSKKKLRKEFPDKRDMPVQTFEYKAKEDGSAYGNDNSMIQKEFGRNNNHPGGKALEQNWDGQAPNVLFRPFDPTAAAGPNHIMQAINGDTYRIWNKTGTVMANGNISALFPSGNGNGDPIILYDKAADRWFMSQFAGGGAGNGIYIAISQTADPLGAWYTYEFTSPDFPDYLKFSAWQDGYYMTANYAEKIFAFNRTKMLAGDATAESVFQTFSPPQDGGFFVPMPGDASDGVMPGAGTPCPIFSYSDNAWGGGNVDAVHIYNAAVTWGGTPNLTVTSGGVLPTNAFDASYDAGWNDIPQQGTTTKLDGIGGIIQFRAQWKSWAGYNTTVLNWPVRISSSQRGIYWVELRQDQTTNVWSIYQQGIYAPGTESFWLGSIAMNDNGDIGLSYAKSGASTYMTLGYSGRLASDPLGTLPIAETIAIAGGGAQTGANRVGDYAQLTLDPDGQTFWYTGEYLAAGGSARTRIYSYQFTPTCTPPTTQATNYTSSAIGDNQMTINWTAGNGDRVLVVAREGSNVNSNPATGTSYTANALFGSGDQIGAGNFVVYEGTGTSVTVTGLTPGTDYYYSVFEYTTATNCYLTPALIGNSVTTGVAPCTVCGDVTSSTDDATGVTEVIFNTISNTSAGDPEYTDYTAMSTDVNTNQTYTLSVKINTAGNYTAPTKAWVDWNQNCVFTDAGEEYDLGAATNVTDGVTSLSPVSITIPAGAALGNTIMRIRTTWEGAGATILPVPCGNQNYSETEDYTINIINASTPPVAIFTPPTPICANSSVTFTDASTSATGWTWDFGDATPTSNMQNPTHTYTSAGPFTVTLTVTNGAGSDMITASITVGSPTTNTLNPTICQGQSFSVGSSTYNATGNYTDVLVNAEGCDSTIATNLTVSPLSTASVSNNGPICTGDDAVFTITGTSGATVTYDLGAGNVTTVLTGGTSIITVSGATSNQTMDISLVDDGTCPTVLSLSSTVNVSGAPTASVTNNGPICAGQDAVFTITGSTGATVTYDLGAGNVTTVLTGGTSVITVAGATSNQTMNLSQVVIGSCNTTLTDVSSVTVNALPSVAITSPSTATVAMCTYNLPLSMVGTPTGGTFSGTGVTSSTFDPAVAGAGTHTVTYTYLDGNSCASSATVVITV